MKPWIERFDWKDQLQYTGTSAVPQKHEQFKFRLVTWIEQHLMGGRQLGGYRNYRLLRGV